MSDERGAGMERKKCRDDENDDGDVLDEQALQRNFDASKVCSPERRHGGGGDGAIEDGIWRGGSAAVAGETAGSAGGPIHRDDPNNGAPVAVFRRLSPPTKRLRGLRKAVSWDNVNAAHYDPFAATMEEAEAAASSEGGAASAARAQDTATAAALQASSSFASACSSVHPPPTPPPTPTRPQRQRLLSSTSWAEDLTPLPPTPALDDDGGGDHRWDDSPSRQQQPQGGRPRPSPPPPPQDVGGEFANWSVGDRYHLVRTLGRGSYGEVAQAIDTSVRDTTKYVAIKKIARAFDANTTEVDALRIYRELHILGHLRGARHPCIIQLLDVVCPPRMTYEQFTDLYLVFEYVDTDLYKLIMSPQYLTTEHIQTFLYQMLTGLKYIHSFSVIHRDLKPANILLNEDCALKICDFGLARIVKSDANSSASTAKVGTKGGLAATAAGRIETKEAATPGSLPSPPAPGLTRQLTKHVVTRWYRAPELILIQPYTSAVDIWSLGCILGELLSMQEGSVPEYRDRMPLFPGGSCYPLSGGDASSKKSDERLDQLNVIFSVIGTPSDEDVESIGKANEYLKSLKRCPGKSFRSIYPAADPAALDLLSHMLQFNPDKRCTAEEALDHEFFRKIRRKEMETKADSPLSCPEFLEKKKIDIDTLKRRTYDEVLWFVEKKQQQTG